MATNPMSLVIQELRTALGRDGAGMTDGELLYLFLNGGDDAALAALVRRHAPMVWGVCRRLLRSHHDAEDAFQATFLVLVRKAASVKPREAVGNWLYGVAHQTAVRMRATAMKRAGREKQVVDMPEMVVEKASHNDLLPLLDRELSCLPDKYRLLIVLCDLESKTRKEVARQLGIPEGTVAGRLARARAMLAKRLARKGLAVSGGVLGAALSQVASSASAPATLVASTIKYASLMAAGQAAAISPSVAALTEGIMKAMLMKKLKTVTALVLMMSVVTLTSAMLAWGQTEEKGKGVEKLAAKAEKQEAPAQEKKEPPKDSTKRMAEEFQMFITSIDADGSVTGEKFDGKGGGGKGVTVKLARDVKVYKGKRDGVMRYAADGDELKLAGLKAAIQQAQHVGVLVDGKAIGEKDTLELSMRDDKPAAKFNGKDIPIATVEFRRQGRPLNTQVTTSDDGVATRVLIVPPGTGTILAVDKFFREMADK